MTTYATATEAIYDYFIDNFTGVNTSTNLAVGSNVDFTPPANQEYIQINVLPGNEIQTSMGTQANFQNSGLFVVDIFTPANAGDVTAKTLMQEVHNLFRFKRISTDIHFKGEISSREFGVDGQYYRMQTTLVYRRNVVYTNTEI